MGGISETEFMSPFCGNIRFVAIIKAMLLCSPVFFPTNAETWLFRERQDETFQEISSRQLILRCCFSLVAKKNPKRQKTSQTNPYVFKYTFQYSFICFLSWTIVVPGIFCCSYKYPVSILFLFLNRIFGSFQSK